MILNKKASSDFLTFVWNSPKVMNSISIFIFVGLVFYVSYLFFSTVLSHSYFDLKNVILVVENNKTPNVKKEDIYKIINESLNGTALNTDLEQISYRILNNLWVLEIGYDQRTKVEKILINRKFYIKRIVKDLAGCDRCIVSSKL